jgi:hypothetical protein
MIWGGKKLSEEDVNELYTILFLQSAVGPIVLAHLLHDECCIWDEIALDSPILAQLVANQNLGKRVLKRVGMIREENIYELTRRMIEVPPPAQLREKTT